MAFPARYEMLMRKIAPLWILPEPFGGNCAATKVFFATFISLVDCGAARTYPVCMNVTLSIDDQTIDRARQLAQQRGTSLNQMIRDYLAALTASDPADAAAELERLWSEEEGDSSGWEWNREEVYDRPVLR